jgi:RsiW-degrading membrane proteinase PrsW (M82 family)
MNAAWMLAAKTVAGGNQYTAQIAMSGAIPAIIAMGLVDRLDRKRPEPPGTRRLAAFLGMLSIIPAIVIELYLSNSLGAKVEPQITYQGSAFHAFVVAAAVEEFCKFAVIWLFIWRKPEFDERMDGLVYFARAGLGFALVENIGYLLMQQSLSGQLTTWILRAVLAVPGHAMWTGMIGLFAARRRFDKKGVGFIGGYLLAVSLHGLYDMCAFLQQPLTLEGHTLLATLMMPVLVAITLLGFLIVRYQAKHALRLDDADVALNAAQAAQRGMMPGQMPPPQMPPMMGR